MSEEVFHAACAACVEDDPAVNSFVSTLVASWEYDRFLALVGDGTRPRAPAPPRRC